MISSHFVMKKENLKKIVNNPEMISGIYNYCDRWCERCSFTSRCAIFAVEQAKFSNPAKDMENAAFWEKQSELFEITMEMILEDAEDLGIDLDDIDIEELAAGYAKVEEQVENHYCWKQSKEYGSGVKHWLDGAEILLAQKEEVFADISRIGIDGTEAKELNDVIAVIYWYQDQIHEKISRGLHGIFDDYEEDEDSPKNSDGSVKVGLIGIDRSIAAWGKMRSIFPEKEDEILELLLQLERLRRYTEKVFPNARDFNRVGFDYPPE